MHTLPIALSWVAGLETPTPTSTVPADSVTPGFIGFAFMAVVVAVVVFLVIDMLRRIRRAGYRADVNEQLDAEEQAQAEAEAAVEASDVDDQDIDGGR